MQIELEKLSDDIKFWGQELGFQQVAITDTNLEAYQDKLLSWLAAGYHGEMDYMAREVEKRCHPENLVPGTKRIIMVRMDYLPPQSQFSLLKNPIKAFISRYATGRDYHKLMRKRLQKLADKINEAIGPFAYRAFTDSAPVLEKPLAEKAGLGWIGKHTNLINSQAGSFFFIGSLFIDLELAIDPPNKESHCGTCQACLDICPTQAIIAPYQLDARRCISYLTIELKTAIPEEFRALIGNRIYGCDDCQLVCPWNKFAALTAEKDFHIRHGLNDQSLLEIFNWSETQFLEHTQGSAIRRIGYEQWLRNVAVGLGNAHYDEKIIAALIVRQDHASELVREHVRWALAQQLVAKEKGASLLGHQYLYKIPVKCWKEALA